MEGRLVPQWLETLLSTQFFTICPSHVDAPRSECNMFCVDCKKDAFCFYCRSAKHQDHHIIQIRRSSYHDVVRVAEIEKVLDISGVQTYVINSARVLFLNERPQPKSSSNNAGGSGKGVPHFCEICGRGLLDSCRFCSLGCKVAGIKKTSNANFNLTDKSDETEGSGLESKEQEEEELRERNQQEIYRNTPLPNNSSIRPHSSSRRRKGIPKRAPCS